MYGSGGGQGWSVAISGDGQTMISGSTAASSVVSFRVAR